MGEPVLWSHGLTTAAGAGCQVSEPLCTSVSTSGKGVNNDTTGCCKSLNTTSGKEDMLNKRYLLLPALFILKLECLAPHISHPSIIS